MAEEIPVRVTPPDGNPMRGDLTDAEIAARNVLPVTNPAGEAIKNIKENHITENKDVVSYRKPNPACHMTYIFFLFCDLFRII